MSTKKKRISKSGTVAKKHDFDPTRVFTTVVDGELRQVTRAKKVGSKYKMRAVDTNRMMRHARSLDEIVSGCHVSTGATPTVAEVKAADKEFSVAKRKEAKEKAKKRKPSGTKSKASGTKRGGKRKSKSATGSILHASKKAAKNTTKLLEDGAKLLGGAVSSVTSLVGGKPKRKRKSAKKSTAKKPKSGGGKRKPMSAAKKAEFKARMAAARAAKFGSSAPKSKKSKSGSKSKSSFGVLPPAPKGKEYGFQLSHVKEAMRGAHVSTFDRPAASPRFAALPSAKRHPAHAKAQAMGLRLAKESGGFGQTMYRIARGEHMLTPAMTESQCERELDGLRRQLPR